MSRLRPSSRVALSMLGVTMLGGCGAEPSAESRGHYAERARPIARIAVFGGVDAPGTRPDAVETARRHLARRSHRLGVPVTELGALEVRGVHDTGRGGVLVAFRPRIGDVEVIDADVDVLLRRDGALLAIGGRPMAASKAEGSRFLFGEPDAIARAVEDAYSRPMQATELVLRDEGPGGYRSFVVTSSSGARPSASIRIKPVFLPVREGLEPAYYLEIVDQWSELTAYVISATDGRVLERRSLVDDAFDYQVYAESSGN